MLQIRGRLIQYYNAVFMGRKSEIYLGDKQSESGNSPDTSTYTRMDLHVVTTIKMSPAKGDANLSNKMRHKFNLCSDTNLGGC